MQTLLYRQRPANRSIPIDQQALGLAKAGDEMTDQQGGGCEENPAKSEDPWLIAKLKIHTDFSAC